MGLTCPVLDSPQPRAMAMLRAEIAAKLAKYEPAVILKSVDFIRPPDADAMDGKLIPAVTISL